jgi:hypothetical protein
LVDFQSGAFRLACFGGPFESGPTGASVLEEQRLKSSFRGINGAAEILYLSSNQLTQLMGNPIRDLQLNFSIPEKF